MKIGMIGTGRIARRFVPEAAVVDGADVVCVYNPHTTNARDFAYETGLPGYTQDFEEFLEKVDAVYIASPHETHYDYTKALLTEGKHVLCEKPLCFKKEQARELYALAMEKNVVLMEAVKTAYCPGFKALAEMVDSGIIGEIKDVETCFTRLTDKNTREFWNKEYGGSFTEFGSYTLFPIVKFLGADYQKVGFQCLREPDGVDEYTKAYFTYKSAMATSKTGLSVKSEGQLVVAGTKGYILAESPWWMTQKFEVRYEDSRNRELFTFPFEGQGLRYEIEAFLRKIAGKEEDEGLLPMESIAIAGIMEEFLAKTRKN